MRRRGDKDRGEDEGREGRKTGGECNSVEQRSSCCELSGQQRGEPVLWESGPTEINERDTPVHQVFETDVTALRSGSSFETKADSAVGGKAPYDTHYISHRPGPTVVVMLLGTSSR